MGGGKRALEEVVVHVENMINGMNVMSCSC